MLNRVVLASLLFTSTNFAAPEQARRAADFIDSVGVCTHWTYLDTPYGQYDLLRDRLVESGIRHLRDGWSDRLPDLASHGITTCIVAEPDKASPAELVASIVELNRAHPGAVDAIEGVNEPDLFWPNQKKSYKGHGFEQGDVGIREGVVMFQRELYAAAKQNADATSLTIIGPALGRTYDPINPFFFKPGELADSVDLGNFHPYAGGNPFSPPFAYAGIQKYIWHGTHPTASLDEFPYALTTYGQTFKPKPMAATECGYSTNTNQTSLEAHGRYLPRLFAEHFRLGIRRSYVYELIDEWDRPDDREANFGLLKHDHSPKPAFTAMKKLIALLNEQTPGKPRTPTPDFALKTIDFDIQPTLPPGYDRPQYVHHLLLQKASGELFLLIWHEIALEDSSAAPFKQLRHPDVPVRLRFPDEIRAIELSVPSDDVPVRTLQRDGDAFAFEVPDRIVVLALKR